MKKSIELSARQMKDVKGGSLSVRSTALAGDNYGQCVVDGEVIHVACLDDAYCQNLYGEKAECDRFWGN